MEIGAQLYTVREFCKTLEDFEETLKKIADIGYVNVQVSGSCAFAPEWLDEKLKENGLRCVVTHVPADRLIAEPAQVAKDHAVFGCENIGLGYYNFSQNSLEEFLEKYKPVAKKIAENGKYFMFHNHDTEFIKNGDKIVLEQIAEAVPAEQLGFILDTFWIQAGGGDPAYWVERFADRVPCIHLKDYAFGRKMAVIGEGNINFERVFAAAEKAGTKYMLVEQDDCNGEDPFVCLKRSFEYLKACGF